MNRLLMLNWPGPKLALALALVLSLSHVVCGQGLQDESSQKRVSNQMLLQQLFSISRNKGLQKELELSDEQLQDIGPLIQNYAQKAQQFQFDNREKLSAIRAAMAERDFEKVQLLNEEIQAKSTEMINETIDELNELLVPDQLARLRQIGLQQAIKTMSGNGDLFGVPLVLAKRLELSDEQTQALRKVVEEEREKYWKEVTKLQKAAMDRILLKLPAEKRDLYRDIVGDHFEKGMAQKKQADERSGFRN